MKSLFLNGRMALMRKTSCLLTVLFALIATVFLLVYPLFMDSARAELEYAYDSVKVTGWLYNSEGFQDPKIDGAIWHALLDSGFTDTHYSYASAELRLFESYFYQEKLVSPEQAITVFEQVEEELREKKDRKNTAWKTMKALNDIQTHEGLLRVAEEIRWLEGWSKDCLTGKEPVCLVASSLGYQPGDLVPVRLKYSLSLQSVFCFRVVGVFPHPSSVGDMDLILPLGALEELCIDQGEDWEFWVNGFLFEIGDNRRIPDLKRLIIDLGLTKEEVRAAIDDRILDGTVSPIKSNLAMLEGLYKFFFVVVAAIGFFLCFLLAKGRKQEYAVMRLLGESSFQVTWKAILEQLLLCLLGIVFGGVILMVAGQGAPDLAACSIILACYTLGAAIAVVLTVRVNVMEILRDKE